ncbi:mitochondrial import inner membrane translocase subunit TIM50 [Punica granatum]|uniref:Mitochondrial import inner membrane translocase subunit TIM50 n=2 Tax=Punica granatum TaxID=22663 RepID=A0A6P8EJT5_PUNGR|nr:mitochondrial import inner membrane translocase subunit TIM50 [Punica granatum]PKI77514.1 hypothetical protein CRG98_002120 [Punica granatum]
MSSMIARSRVSSLLAKHNRRFLSSDVSINSHKESIIASQSLISEQAPPPPPEEPAPPAQGKRSWNFLKYSLVAAFTGVAATAVYATCAYSADEIDDKTKAFRASVSNTAADTDSAVEKFQTALYSAAMTVPAKAIDLYLDLRRQIEEQVQGFTEPTSDKLLPDLHPMEQHVFTLVLDLNETLVYSDWKRERGWRTFKRPGVDAFLEQLAKYYEIVIYSDQLSMYVDPVVERLDGKQCIRYKLNRSATKYQDGKHYRDLSKLNRNPGKVIYISGHASESCLQQENCVQIKPWKLEADDTALLDLIPFLEFVATRPPQDIRPVLASYEGKDIPKEFIKRSQDYQRRMQEQRQGRSLWRH